MLKKIIRDTIIFFQIRVSCPACMDMEKHTPQSFWTHDNCGGEMFVGDNATVLCEKCKENKHIKFWSFHCPKCDSLAPYRLLRVHAKSVINAHSISVMGQMVSETGHRWIIDFMRNMSDF